MRGQIQVAVAAGKVKELRLIPETPKATPEALNALQLGLKQVTSPALAFKTYAFLTEAGKIAEADKFSTKWQIDNPADLNFLLYLGDAALARNDLLLAEKIYLSLINKNIINYIKFYILYKNLKSLFLIF